MNENGHQQNLQDVLNYSKNHQEHKPSRKRIHHTWTFLVFVVLVFAAIMYYMVSVDFSSAPRNQSKQPIGNTQTP
jgi:heme/copper-type cytochrome/quinol oxidase subunit 3